MLFGTSEKPKQTPGGQWRPMAKPLYAVAEANVDKGSVLAEFEEALTPS